MIGRNSQCCSILGPLVFNIFINDLFLTVERAKVCNYAGDNSLTVADICVDKIPQLSGS